MKVRDIERDSNIVLIEDAEELQEAIDRLKDYDFRDAEGHPLHRCSDFISIIVNLRDKLILDRMHE